MQTIIDKLNEREPGKTESRASHPVVVALGSRGNIQQVFLAVEGEVVPIVRGGVISGIDRMMKTYFVLNMKYPDESSHVLHFLQKAIYGVADDLPLSRGASDLALFIKSKNRNTNWWYIKNAMSYTWLVADTCSMPWCSMLLQCIPLLHMQFRMVIRVFNLIKMALQMFDQTAVVFLCDFEWSLLMMQVYYFLQNRPSY